MVAKKQLFLRHADVVTACLNASMPDEVYIKLPSICGDNPDIVRKLLRALCNHSKSGNLWKTDFINFMVQEDFQWCSRDMRLFF